MKTFFLALVCGLIFGAGILISGMANPAKIINFFDIFGTFDPSLALVVVGAVSVTSVGYRLVWRQPKPLLAPSFTLPTKTALDLRLISGAGLFGIGWGIAGFCPGGAIPALGLLRPEPFLFCAMMLAGMWIGQKFDQWHPGKISA